MLNQLIGLSRCGLIDLFFADESGFKMTPCVPYGWQQKGEQVRLVPKDAKKLNVLGFMALDNRLISYCTEENINGEFVCKSIDDFIQTTSQPTVIVIDNAPFHRCELLYSKILEWQQQDIYIFFLPKYSPHLNRIEILWRKIKYEWLKPKDYLSRSRMVKAVKAILTSFGTEYTINFKELNFT